MKVPFCLPLIDSKVIEEVNDTLTNTGWLTTGPKTAQFENELASYCRVEKVLAVNSWNAGATLMLRWWGIKEGDEVIIPAYTYSATALTAINLGAKVIMVDVNDDFNINVARVRNAISNKTKAIIPVDIAGLPCDYNALNDLVNEPEIKSKFVASNAIQEKLGRILILSDAAHSIGAEYQGRRSGALCDLSVFSFHSVKNITTGEGGAVALNLPAPFDNSEVYDYLKHFHLYGQTKSAIDKNKSGNWRYDIVSQGMKANMNDVCASIGLSQLRRYQDDLLPQRKKIFERYSKAFGVNENLIVPTLNDTMRSSSAHLYMLRFKGISEDQRDRIIEELKINGVGVSVHYIPMATLSLFKAHGYNIEDYPNTYTLYANEISLPIYNGLSDAQVDYVTEQILKAFKKVNTN